MSGFATADFRPLRFWPEDRLRVLAGCIDVAVDGWTRAWGLPARAAEAACATPSMRAEFSQAHALGRRDEAVAWLLERGPGRASIGAGLFAHAPIPGTVAADVAQACESDFLARLRAALDLDEATPCAPPVEAHGRWSGWVLASLSPNAALLVSPAAVARVVDVPGTRLSAGAQASPRAPLVAVDDALAARAVRVRVELEGSELGLGVLNGLQCGDVLRLKHSLAAPATARHASGDALFDGYLVRRGSRRALELRSRAAAGGEQP